MVERLRQFERVFTRFLETVVTIFFFVILILTIILVVLRYGFNSTIIGANEAMDYLFIYTTAFGAAVAVGKNEHIRISFLTDKLSPKFKAFSNIVNYFLIAFINTVMIYYSLPWIKSAGLFESPVLRIPNRIIQVSVPIGGCFVIVYCVFHIGYCIRRMAGEGGGDGHTPC